MMTRMGKFLAAGAAVILCGILFLVGCGAGGNSGSGGFWAIGDYTQYTVDGATADVLTQSFDETGRLLRTTWNYEEGDSRVYVNDEFDEHGFTVRSVVTRYDAQGGIMKEEERIIVLTFDESGRLIASETDGVTTYYTYHDNGVLAESSTSQGYVSRFDERGRKVFYDGGFLNRNGRGGCTFRYDEDSRGNVTGWTATFENGESYTFTCKLDSHGNITDVYGADGSLLVHAEYVLIANPCDAMRLYNITRVGTYLVTDSAEQWLSIPRFM